MPATPGGPTAAGSPTTPVGYSGPDGWYVLQYLDGSLALVYLKNHVWQFSGGIPNGTRTATPWYAGPSGSALLQDPSKLTKLFQDLHATAKQDAALVAVIDRIATSGHSLFVTPGGKTSGVTLGGDVTSTSILNPNPSGHLSIPNPLDALSGLFSEFADLLVRILEALVGVALLFLGLQALTGTGGQGQPIATVKRYAH